MLSILSQITRTRGWTFSFNGLAARQIETEAEAWTLLIQSLNLPEAEIRSFLKAWKLSNQLIQNVSQLVRGLRFRLSNDWRTNDAL